MAVAQEFGSYIYLNDDEAWLPVVELMILDEIHKMPNCKNYLKGIGCAANQKFLVIGSARLEAGKNGQGNRTDLWSDFP